jgi:hypothetical protein
VRTGIGFTAAIAFIVLLLLFYKTGPLCVWGC